MSDDIHTPNTGNDKDDKDGNIWRFDWYDQYCD